MFRHITKEQSSHPAECISPQLSTGFVAAHVGTSPTCGAEMLYGLSSLGLDNFGQFCIFFCLTVFDIPCFPTHQSSKWRESSNIPGQEAPKSPSGRQLVSSLHKHPGTQACNQHLPLVSSYMCHLNTQMKSPVASSGRLALL